MRKLIFTTVLALGLVACKQGGSAPNYVTAAADQLGTYNSGAQTVCGQVNAGKCINLRACIGDSALPAGSFLNTTGDHACIGSPGHAFPCPNSEYVLSCSPELLVITSSGQFVSNSFQ